ncbi:hypothetical protein HN51_010327 [Arachis hypogaea]
MAFRIPGIRRATKSNDVPKGYLAVYVGDKMRRFVIPVSYLNQTLFQELLNQTEEEFGYDYPNGGLTIPCREDEFLNLASQLSRLGHILVTTMYKLGRGPQRFQRQIKAKWDMVLDGPHHFLHQRELMFQKANLAVYVGDKMKRFVIPVSYLNQPSFQELLCQAEEEFGYDHPTGGLTIPCSEDEFQNLTSEFSGQ